MSGFVPNEIPAGKEYLFEGGQAAAAARGGVSVSGASAGPVETPEQRQEAAKLQLALIQNEAAQNPSLATDPAHQREKARISELAGGVAANLQAIDTDTGESTPLAGGPAASTPTWDEVLKLPEMRDLPSEKLDQARHQYFVDVVAPQVPTEKLSAARAAFDADTKPGAIHTAVRKLGEAIDYMKTSGAAALARRGLDAAQQAAKPVADAADTLASALRPGDRTAQDARVQAKQDERFAAANASTAQMLRSDAEPGIRHIVSNMRASNIEAIRNGQARPFQEEQVKRMESQMNPVSGFGDPAERTQDAQAGVAREKYAADFWNNISGFSKTLEPQARMTMGGILRAMGDQLNARLDTDGEALDENLTGQVSEKRNRAVELTRIGQDFYDAGDYMSKEAMKGLKPGTGAKAFGSAMQSVSQMLVPVLAGAVTGGSATVPLALMGLTTFGQQYGQGRQEGLTPAQSAVYAGIYSAVEVGTEFAPVKALMAKNPHTAAWFWNFLAKEVPSELLATTFQSALDKVSVTPEMSWKDFQDAMLTTVLSTPIAAGAQAGAVRAATGTPNGFSDEQRAEIQKRYDGEMAKFEKLRTDTSDFSKPGPVVDDGKTKALPDGRVVAGAQPNVETATAEANRVAEAEANAAAVYAARDAEEQRQAALKEKPAAPAAKPEGVKSMIADPDAMFDEVKKGKGIFATIKQALRDTPEYKAAKPAEQFDLDAAVDSITADPKEIFRLAKSKPELYATIARAADETQKLARAPKGAPDAGSLRVDEGKIPEGRADGGAGQDQSGQDLQRQAEAGAAAGDEVRRGERGAPGASEVDAAAHAAATSTQNDLPQPTEAQREAGNYAKGHTRVAGMDISIENPEGSKRRPEWPALKQHYGYFKGTEGFDKDHVDVFVKPGTPEDFNGQAYVVNQTKADGSFDEHKVMLGFDSEEAARKAYNENYTKGWDRGKSVVAMPLEQLKAWATDKTDAGPKGGELKQLPAKKEQLFVQRGKKRFAVDSLEEASKKWNTFRDATGAGASEIGEDALIVNQDGKVLGHISYNGKVWPGRPQDWKPGTKPLVGEEFKPRTLAQINEQRKMMGFAALDENRKEIAAKEPWRLTRDQYVESFKGKTVKRTGFQNRLGTLQYAHSQAVEAALQLGKPVPDEVRNEYPEFTKTYPDRRRDAAQRKKVAEMAPEEMRKALLSDTLTGLGNRRAYDESAKLPVQVSIDLDSLKWINDNLGHAAGDQVLKALGTAIGEETEQGYHLSGDEFALQADTEQAAAGAIAAIQQRLAGAELVFKKPDGSTVTKKGVDFSHGIGASLEEADGALRADKERREAEGQRARRGEPARGVSVGPAEGQQAAQRETPAEKVGRKGRTAFARGGAAGQGMPIADVRKEVDRLTAKWENAPRLRVLESPAAAPFKAPENALGAYLNDTAYLFASNLSDAGQVQFTVFHEVLGHHGLRALLGDEEEDVLSDIALRNKNVRSAAVAWRAGNEKPAGWSDEDFRLHSIEEALSDLAGKGETISGFKKVLAAIQRWLRARGFDKVAAWIEGLSDAEALDVLAKARRHVTQGEQADVVTSQDLAPAFHTPPAKSFADAIKDLVTGKSDRRDVVTANLTVPPVLRLIGMKEHRIVMGGNTIDKVLYDHGVPMTTVQKVPELLADPVMIFESDTVPGDFVVVTTAVFQNKPLLVTLRPDGDINREVVNVITSTYPRNNPGEAFARWIKGDLLAYVDEAKRPGWQRSLGLRLPGKMPSRGAGKRLLTQQDLVNASGGSTPGTKESPAFARAAAAGITTPTQAQAAKKKSYSAIANAVIDRIDKALDPILGLPNREDYLKLRNRAQGAVDKTNDIAREIYDTFSKGAPADTKAAYEYLTTKDAKPDAIADKAVRDHAVRVKDMIDQVGLALVKHRLLSEETFEEHRGAYLPRIYLKHLLDERDFARVGGGRKPSEMGYLKKRTDIPKEVREILMGEIKDPGYLASVGFTRALRDIHLIEWMAGISKNKEWVLPKSLVEFDGHKVTPFWLKAEAARVRDQAEHQEAAIAKKARELADRMDAAAAPAMKDVEFEDKDWKQMPNTARYGRLRGIVVRQEIYNDIVGIGAMVPPDAGWAEKLLGYGGYGTKLTQLWKASKVSLNPPSQIRNWVSNGVLLHLSGVSMVKIPIRLGQAAKAIRENGKAWQIAKKGGIKANTFSATELRRIETEMLDIKAKESGSVLAHIGSVLGKGFNAAGDVYQFSESLFKTAKIIDELARGHSEDQAVLEANKWLFDYSRVSPSVRYLRNAPIGAPFLTFMVKVAPRLVEVGLKHPQRYLPYLIASYAIPYAVASMLGVGPDDLDRLKKLLPESWKTKGHVYVLPYKDQYGRWQILDLSYFMPWAQFDQTGRQLLGGDVIGATKTLGIIGGPIPDIITAWKTNKDPFTGRDIVPKGAPPALQLGALLTYAMNIALPPWLTSNGLVGVDLGDPAGMLSGKLASAAEGKTNRYGDPVTTPAQAALSLVGVNMRSVDPQTDRARLLQQAQRGIADTRTELKHHLEDHAMSPETKARVKGVYVDEMKRRSEKARTLADETRLPPEPQ